MVVGWDKCPLEVQQMVVQRATETTRNALKVCSFESRDVVEKTKIRMIHDLLIGRSFRNSGSWTIRVSYSKGLAPLERDNERIFRNFEKFRIELAKVLKSAFCIKTLFIAGQLPIDVPWNLSPFPPSKLRVEKLITNVKNGEVLERILCQIEPVYLSHIELDTDGGNDKVYDMQQIICAESLKIHRLASIREDQLMKLQAQNVLMKNIQCNVSEYAKRSALEASAKLRQFSFTSQKVLPEFEKMPSFLYETMLLKTGNPQLQLQLKTTKIPSYRRAKEGVYKLDGRFRFDSEITSSNLLRRYPSELRKIKSVKLYREKELGIYKIEVARNDHRADKYKFYLFVSAQEKLYEILAGTDHISLLDIDFQNLNKPMEWAERVKKISVFSLQIRGDHSITKAYELMRQIDPVHVKKICIYSQETDDRIFNMPHMEHVLYLDISGAVFNDAQLLKMRAHTVNSTNFSPRILDQFLNRDVQERVRTADGLQNKLLTANGLNKYMKKCLTDTQQPYHIFVFRNLAETLNIEELFEGLNIVRSPPHFSDDPTSGVFTIPETAKKYELVLGFDGRCLYGVRCKANQHIQDWDYLKNSLDFFLMRATPNEFFSLMGFL